PFPNAQIFLWIIQHNNDRQRMIKPIISMSFIKAKNHTVILLLLKITFTRFDLDTYHLPGGTIFSCCFNNCIYAVIISWLLSKNPSQLLIHKFAYVMYPCSAGLLHS